MSLDNLINEIIAFRDRRNWRQFHTPANLAAAISIEAAELQELFLWGREPDIEKLHQEIADILIFTFTLCHDIGRNPYYLVKFKLAENERKYPVEKAYGRNDKSSKL